MLALIRKAASLDREPERAFDIGPTVRTARVVETIERFLAAVRDRDRAVAPAEAIG